MRSFAKRLGDLVKDEVSEDEMKKVKQEMLSEVGQFKHFSCKTGLSRTNLCTTNNGVFFISLADLYNCINLSWNATREI
jgi:hypothetical protein